MRIIAGKLGGRHFASPRGHRTHPMSDKMRGGLFSALGDIEGLTLLDPFAGSGAISFEALSRGAKQATAIDEDLTAYKTMLANAGQLSLAKERFKAIRATCGAWSKNNPEALFDLIIADPPYYGLLKDKRPYDHLQQMSRHLKNGGLLVLSMPSEERAYNQLWEGVFDEDGSLRELMRNHYGDAQLVFYRKVG